MERESGEKQQGKGNIKGETKYKTTFLGSVIECGRCRQFSFKNSIFSYRKWHKATQVFGDSR